MSSFVRGILNIFINAICLVLMYFLMKFSRESAFMFALFVAIFMYKNVESRFQSHLYQCIIALFCAVFLDISDVKFYILQCISSLFFIRIYDFYKPSFIARFYNSGRFYDSSKAFGLVLSAILNGILSAISTLVCFGILSKATQSIVS